MARDIPWWQPRFDGDELDRLRGVIESGFVNDGPVTASFEKAVADLCGAAHAVAVTSGTTALYLALKAVGVEAGDEVIVPDLTFIATANAVSMAGATPVLVDIEPDRLGLDPDAFAAAITKRTKAVIPVHVSGRPARIKEICDIAADRQIAVVEDAAEALGSTTGGRQLGTFGDMGCFSLSPNKTITSGQGGIIVTNNENLWRQLQALKDQGRPVRGTGGADHHPSIGFNFKFTDLQAAVGMAQLANIEARLDHLRSIYRHYAAGLDDVAGLSVIGFDVEDGACPQWVDLRVDEGRDDLVQYLQSENIGCREFWRPISSQPAYGDQDENPVATHASAHSLWLPSSFDMTKADLDRVCSTIRRWRAAGS